MATKSKTSRNAGRAGPSSPMTGLAEAARRNYEEAIRAGQRLQEEAGQWWTRMLNQTAAAADWQGNLTRFNAVAGNVVPLAQKCLEGVMGVMEKSTRTSAELMEKALDATQTQSWAECQAKWMEFWTSSMKAAQSNVEAITQLNTRTMDSCINLVRKSSNVANSRVPEGA